MDAVFFIVVGLTVTIYILAMVIIVVEGLRWLRRRVSRKPANLAVTAAQTAEAEISGPLAPEASATIVDVITEPAVEEQPPEPAIEVASEPPAPVTEKKPRAPRKPRTPRSTAGTPPKAPRRKRA